MVRCDALTAQEMWFDPPSSSRSRPPSLSLSRSTLSGSGEWNATSKFARSPSIHPSPKQHAANGSVSSNGTAHAAATSRMTQLAASSVSESSVPPTPMTPFRGMSRRDLVGDRSKPHSSTAISARCVNDDHTAAKRRAWVPTGSHQRPGVCPHCGTAFTTAARMNHHERGLVYVCTRCKLTLRVGPSVALESGFKVHGDIISTHNLLSNLQRTQQQGIRKGAQSVLKVLSSFTAKSYLQYGWSKWLSLVSQLQPAVRGHSRGGDAKYVLVCQCLCRCQCLPNYVGLIVNADRYEEQKMRQFKRMLAGATMANKDQFVLSRRLLEPFISGAVACDERRRVMDYEADVRSESLRAFLRGWRTMMRNEGCEASGREWFQLLADRGYEDEVAAQQQQFSPVPLLTDYIENVCLSADDVLEQSRAACQKLDRSSQRAGIVDRRSIEHLGSTREKFHNSGLSCAGALPTGMPGYMLPSISVHVGARETWS